MVNRTHQHPSNIEVELICCVPCVSVVACSVERWAISYDRNLHTREVQAAVSAMNEWRNELLSLVD